MDCMDPMDHSPPGSSIHGILQARILSGLPCPSPGNFSHAGIKPPSTVSPVFQADSLPMRHQGILWTNRLVSNKDVRGFPGWAVVKNPLANTGDIREGLDPRVRKIPWSRKGNPLQHSYLENPNGQRSLVGCGPWGHKESDTTEQLSTAQHSLMLRRR